MRTPQPPSLHHLLQGWLGHWRALLWPAPILTTPKERLRAALGAGLGLLFMAALCQHMAPSWPGTPWMIAPLGASAVLVFAVPAGPMAQPWAVIGGNTLSAVVGCAFAMTGLPPLWAGPAAVCLAIAVMMSTRSLHPPGGAVALTAVLTHAAAWRFPLFPVLLNSTLLVLAGAAYNRFTGRAYPHAQGAAKPAPSSPALGGEASQPDALGEVLRRYNQVLDVSRDDLEALLHETERLAYRRRLGELHCAQIMTSNVITVQFGTPLQEAWDMLNRHRIKALPVVDQYQHLVGIVTRADFLRHAGLDAHEAVASRLRQLLRATAGAKSEKAEVVGQIMTRQVRVASAHRPLMDLVPLFTDGGHHHIPIVGEHRKLVGIITQSDFLQAWSRAVQDGWQTEAVK